MTPISLPGVSAMSAYVPRLRVDLKQWCQWTGNSWDKINAVVGRSFRVCGRHENVYTMAANAVLRLVRENGVDPRQVGFLGLGTESSTDNAAGAVIVRGMFVMPDLDRPAWRAPTDVNRPGILPGCLPLNRRNPLFAIPSWTAKSGA
jgi:hypothetical protein